MRTCFKCGEEDPDPPMVTLCERCDEKRDAALIAKGRADERAKVVAWLKRWPWGGANDVHGVWMGEESAKTLADAIERGDHVRSGGERGGEP